MGRPAHLNSTTTAVLSTVLLLALFAPTAARSAETGNATLSVGITIVAADDVATTTGDAIKTAQRNRIAVDPAYAIRLGDPLRDARVERIEGPDGEQLQVVSY